MIVFVARIALVTLSLGWQVELAVADGPPRLNAGPSCDAADRGAIILGRDKEACMDDERAAEDVLTNAAAIHKADGNFGFGNFGKYPKGEFVKSTRKPQPQAIGAPNAADPIALKAAHIH
jgi:hypothetical protein